MPAQTFTSSGTWTAPGGTTSVTVEKYAGGGGGASWPINGGGSGGGGGGGEYTIQELSVTPGNTYSINVGGGGGAGSGDGGSDGGDSSTSIPGDVAAQHGGGAYRTHGGGAGVNAQVGGSGRSSDPATGAGGGGAGSPGGTPTQGGDGSLLGGGPTTPGGAGGSFGGGDGGNISFGTPGNGADGSFPGGGGGGGSTFVSSGGSGGNGGGGQIILTWTPMASSITVTGQSRITAYGSIAVTGQARITDQPQSGYNIIRMTTAPATGKSLQVRYYRLGQDLIVCEDTPLVAQRAAIEEGNGKYHQLAQDSGNTNFSAGLQTTQKALATYKTLPQTAMLKTFRPGLLAGMYLTVKIRTGGYWNLPDFLNSTWLIQQVDGQYIPFLYGVSESLLTWDDATMTWDEATFTWDATDSYEFGPLLYTITLISVARIPNWVDDWEKLAQRG